jgi:hypothetical protein
MSDISRGGVIEIMPAQLEQWAAFSVLARWVDQAVVDQAV